jgi:geranylgeranyl pyrophosphate synthase
VLGRVGAADLDAEEIASIQQVIVETGALDELEAAIERLSNEAIEALASIDITVVARDELAALAHFVVGRAG